MTREQFDKWTKRAADLSVCTLNDLRSISPSAVGDTEAAGIQASKFSERSGATTKEIKAEYVIEILEEEFGHLLNEPE